MIPINNNEKKWLRENGYAHKVKMSGTKRHAYLVEDYRYKFDADGTTVLSATPIGALKALYKHREDIKTKK